MKKILLLKILFLYSYAASYAIGAPQNLGMCTDTATGCFDLTVNDSAVLTGLNPADYFVTYYTSEANATAGLNPVSAATSYCIAPGTQTMYVRTEELATGEFEVQSFSISVHTAFGDALVLAQMVGCDDDGDGFAVFNLVEGAYLIDDMPLSFYPTMADALAQTNEITTPTAYSLAAGVNSDTNIIVRQEITGDCDLLTTLPIIALPSCNLGNMCQGAKSLCESLGVPFSNNINIEEAQPFYYACLAQTPNPSWFYIPIATTGNVHLKIEQNSMINFSGNELDADYIIFGPFDDPITPCGNGTLMGNNIDSCSNSIENVEFPQLNNVQPGQYYLMMVTNFYNQPGYIRITQMPSSTAEIDCTGFTLTAFLDANSNGTKDTGEQNFSLGQFSYEINGDSIIHNVVAPDGSHNIYESAAANVYDLSYQIDPDYAANYSLSTSAYNDVTISAAGGMTEYFFPVTATSPYNDVAVAIISEGSPMPGFEYVNRIVFTNLGSSAVGAGTITFTKDPLLEVLSVTPAGSVASATGFVYDYTNLQPFETRELVVTMQVPVIPTVTLGQSLTSSVAITPLDGDLVVSNNTFGLSEKIIGSFDPNDKMESHGGEIPINEFSADDYLYYTIRFENTGTAPAINIRVTDVLDESLDAGSLRMVSASHDYTMDWTGNEITWRFDNILLPFTSQDPVGSHGYITFRIKPLPGFEAGDVIPNTASIFFDFNPPIVTNTFNTEFVLPLAVGDHQTDDFLIYPNPARSSVTIRGSALNGVQKINLYDMLGNRLMSHELTSQSDHTVDVSDFAGGIYLVESVSASGTFIKKLIIR